MVSQWIEDEFSTLDLNDKRRDRRAKIIVQQLSSMADSTPDACRDNAALEATYRFADSDAISPNTILLAHRDAAMARSNGCETVILAQDTTIIDLTKPRLQVKGAGPLESNDKFGYFFHPLYAISEQGVPLGIMDHVTWVREPLRNDLTRAEKAAQRRQACYEEKESCRWLEMFQSGEQIARANPQTHYVHVADSESDIYELFLEIEDQAENHDFILRGCQNRSLVQNVDGVRSIDEALAGCEIRSECEVNISERTSMIAGETRPRRKSRTSRIATTGVRATTVTLRGPDRAGGRLRNVTLNVVEAIELDPPDGEEAIRWVLLTSLPIDTVLEVERVVSQYSLRWGIELFFKTLKSGLGIEKMKYETIERYQTASSLLMIVAWRVEQIKVAARVDSEASCEKYFEAAEWQPAYMIAKKARVLPLTVPTMAEFTLLLAQLGGYLKKKGQGPPGSTTLWRGLRKLEAYREAFIAFGTTRKDV
jgi:hypothetical protein